MPTTPINLNELIRDGKHFAETRGAHIHVVDSTTGVSVAVIPINARGAYSSPLIETTLEDGTKVWAPAGMNPIVGGTRAVIFSPLLIDVICAKITEGGNITTICQGPGMPTYATLCQWRRQHKWIDERLEQARRDRAEYLRDRALIEAMETVDADDAIKQRLKHDALKWAAGVDHEKYNPKTKIDAVVSAPTQIIVHTGISREVHDAGENPKEILPQSSQGSERLLEVDGTHGRAVRQDDVQLQTLLGASAELVSGEGKTGEGDAST